MDLTTNRPISRAAAVTALAAVVAVGAAGCGGPEHEARSADDGRQGKQSGLLADWVPDDATQVRVEQTTTSSERLLTFVHRGGLPPSCSTLTRPGSPTEAELARAYAADPTTRDMEPSDVATRPTYRARWWPTGQQERTTELCGRWWVSHRADRYYAWAPGSIHDPR